MLNLNETIFTVSFSLADVKNYLEQGGFKVTEEMLEKFKHEVKGRDISNVEDRIIEFGNEALGDVVDQIFGNCPEWNEDDEEDV